MERSTQETCTLYEVYDKRTKQPILSKRSGEPCRAPSMSGAAFFAVSASDSKSTMYRAAHDNFEIPAGAELDVRPVKSEVPS